MKQFWLPKTIFDYFSVHHNEGKSLSGELPSGVYCSENFLWSEFLSNQSEMPSLLVLENLYAVASRLQALRDTVFQGGQVVITSGWRSQSYNKRIGGEALSKHLLGQAADICVKNVPPGKVQTLLQSYSGGLGMYKNFTHIDISTKRRWYGQD